MHARPGAFALLVLALAVAPAALGAAAPPTNVRGVISALGAGKVTVRTDGGKAVTCGTSSYAGLTLGASVTLSCKRDGRQLVVTRLARTENAPPATTTTTTAVTTTTTAGPARPAATDARGVVSSIRGDGITVTRGDGSSLSCAITSGQAGSLAAGMPVGTRVRMVCSLDGTAYRFYSIERDAAEPAKPVTTTPAPVPAPPSTTDARGKISSLRGDGLSVTRDDGSTLACGATPGQMGSISIAYPLGSRVRLVCNRDGSAYRLATIGPA
jgi:hypothetical protein